MPRVIAKQADAALLIETRTVDDLRYGVVYDPATGEIFPELPIMSIAARGYWIAVDPADYDALIESISPRLPKEG